jgi:hypothetical protein
MATIFSDTADHRQAASLFLPLLSAKAPAETPALPPAAVLPEQFYQPVVAPASMPGVLALMRAVIDDALWCWQKQFVTHSRRERRLAREAEQGFLSNNHSWPFAFVNICAALGLDPNYIRQGLRHWQHTPPPRVSRASGHAVTRQRHIKFAA